MKQKLKVSLMALVAMFAFNTVADAQLGGLLKKAKAAVSGSKSSNNAVAQAKAVAQAPRNETVKAEIKPYDPNSPLPEGKVVRTIFTMPGTNQKMMLDRSGSGEVTNVQYESFKEYFTNKCQDDKMLKKAEEFLYNEWGRYDAYDLLRINKPSDVKWKIGYIGTPTTSWEYARDNWGEILYRHTRIYVVLEFADGENLCGCFTLQQPYIGGGKYDEESVKVTSNHINFSNTPYAQNSLSGWEVKTDCYTSTLTGK